MEKIRELIQKPLYVAIAAFIVGLLFGWFVMGWGIAPVEWTDAAPDKLRADLKVDYLKMAVDSYSVNKDLTLAKQRWQDLGEDAEKILAEVQAAPGTITPQQLAEFSAVVASGVTLPVVTPAEGEVVQTPVAVPTTETEQKPARTSGLFILLGVLCVALLVVGGVLAYIFLIKPKAGKGEGAPAAAFEGAEPAAGYVEGQETPVSQFMTSYALGDDLYDDSFSIDSPSGEFLGECGVGISETIGVGDPKKVTAFEVWLFDKNDIQTVTKVLMSPHAFNDAGIYQRLESKGEPVLTEPGKRILLETATLQLEARIVDLAFGSGALPTDSYFDRLTLELSIWPKEKA